MMQQSTLFKAQLKFLLGLLVLFLFACCMASAQSTTTTATVVDQNSVVWKNGTWQLQFDPNPNYPSNNVYWNNNPFPTSQWSYKGNLDSSGAFSQSIPSNDFITPTGSTYTLTVCPNATAPCSVIKGLTLQGTSLDLSSTVTSNTPGLSVKPLPLARAYNDAEVNVNESMVGYFYMRVTDNQPRYWGQDLQWHNFVTGLATFTSGNLPPLFTTSDGGDPLNPNLTFTLNVAPPNQVFGNCTGSTSPPAYCSLTLAMLPGGISASTANTLAGPTTNCSNANQWSKGITTAGVANCSQVGFTNLSGNINTSQMNGGTNADASHYWAGGNSGNGQWLAFPTLPAVQESFTVTGCTPASSTDSTCTGNITLATSMPDTSYQVFVQTNSINGAFLYTVVSGSLTTTTVPYTITCTFNCSTVVAPTLYVFARHN